MKKNVKTYVLLAVVLAIWGTIAYRILAPTATGTTQETDTASVSFKPLAVQKKDTFSIIADYRDPFLGTVPKKPKKNTKRTVKPATPALPEIVINYTGLITDSSTEQNIFFVTINGKQHLMNLQQEIDKVRLLSGTASSIKVRYHNKTKTIARSQ
ncbi:hypothetical protein [Maribacter sp. 2-571]|uniref:hypothetical protein n=1 Tax=Maribacter sp. 2-571 TaxID=3417569 RepID=UPI003D3305D5